ncbi:ATP-binding protein [Poseidonocella sedimentorum]|uniref:histidine kinase n=1 Tax=Poseidonocella sedimentorum TaxID=871652 RepID=A0A1I6DYP3_9RHOB|nr:ATP-binding protein [Poseidonocella sedimentorum]SFR10451.1 Signal transduction histidine kinase [Poseidonocella sedimentorum]
MSTRGWASRLLPDGLAARFALLLVGALLIANLIALAALQSERTRLDRQTLDRLETERIISLVPVIEALDPSLRGEVARDSSTRLARVSIDDAALVRRPSGDARARAIVEELSAELPGRRIRVRIMERPNAEDQRWRGNERLPRRAVAISIELTATRGQESRWLNILSAAPPRPARDLQQEVVLLLLGASLVAVLAVALLFIRYLTQPLAALARAARAAGRGDRSIRVAETGAREMRAAAEAFNDMQARIARFDAERMRLLAAVGHDLRTPITSLRLRAELIDTPEAEAMIRTLDDMTIMAEGLVAYARGAVESEAPEEIAASAFLQEIAAARDIPLDLRAEARLRGRPVALRRAIGNLLDNAARYASEARLVLELDGDEALLSVEDRGPGIPEDRMAGMVEPFVRGEESRNLDTGGAGLGLAIARMVAESHGGRLELANRPGGGLQATLRLPTAPR